MNIHYHSGFKILRHPQPTAMSMLNSYIFTSTQLLLIPLEHLLIVTSIEKIIIFRDSLLTGMFNNQFLT